MENRYYQIGELAGILNLSRQMIRYYEECGVIRPQRIAGNNYRLYSAMDYFALGEAISLSRFGINIKDISSLKMSDYTDRVIRCYRDFIADSRKDIAYRQLLVRRAEDMIEKMETAAMNIGNIWVRKVPGHVLYPLMRSENDTYGEVCTPENSRMVLSSADNVAFFDARIEFAEQGEFWWSSIEQKYAEALQLPVWPECRTEEAHYCCCTVMDMGAIGEFDSARVKAFEQQLPERFTQAGPIYGILLARGEENGQYHRYMEVRIPIKP